MQLSVRAMSCCVLTGSLPLVSATAAAKIAYHGLKLRHLSSSAYYYPSSFREKSSPRSSVLGRNNWSSSGEMRPLSSIYGMASDSSNASPLSHDDDIQSKDHHPAKGGIMQSLQKFITGRSAQKEELTDNLKRYGVAGILSYGLLNTFYYLVTFLFVWFYVAPSDGGLGFVHASKRFVKVFAMVWAGSQVTKLIRAAGALTLAPFVDRGLNWYTDRFNFKSRGKAFSFIVGVCILLAISVFLVITTLWA